ncbi:hypothetical protein EsH8_VIII_000292 [Colletotrichum jinshuiense]
MSISIALVGGGIWAREEHAPAIEAAEGLVLKAVFSRSITSAQSIADTVSNAVELYSDDTEKGFEDLLKRSDISAVVISLPIANQPPYIKAALLAGKHVLSEKPVAENLEEARSLIHWYRTEIQGPTWAVAENWRFLKSYEFGAEQIKGLVTEWRRNPTHQGGYLLDGGVHYMAGLRYLLDAQPGNEIDTLVAFTNQIQDYLPPVDTADVILKTRSGVTGVFQISRGTTLRADEWTVACEEGWVKIENEKVTISRNGQVEVKILPNERTGVPPEMRAWRASLSAGKLRPEQEPEAALADLELVELFLKSGQQGGVLLTCRHQIA